METQEKRFRLVVLGSGKVGKTAIIQRYLHGTFDKKYRETVEDLYLKDFNLQGMKISLEILDTNFDYPDMRKVAIASANAFMLVFAVNDVPSFKQMCELWSQIVQQRKDARILPTVIVGNKSDSSSQKIFEATVQAWTQRLNSNVSYVESSAMMNRNIIKIFQKFLEQSGLSDEKITSILSSSEANEKLLDDVNTTLSKIRVSDSSKLEDYRNRLQDTFCTIPPKHILTRNWSLRVNRAKEYASKGFTRSSSLLRRSKHLSLKLKRREKEVPAAQPDTSDCKIS